MRGGRAAMGWEIHFPVCHFFSEIFKIVRSRKFQDYQEYREGGCGGDEGSEEREID